MATRTLARRSSTRRPTFRGDRGLNIASYAVVIVVIIFAIGPLGWTFLTSLKPEEDIITTNMQYIPQRITFDNYGNLLSRSNFPALIGNSLVTTVLTLIICTTLGTLASYSLSRYRFRGRSALLMFYLVIRMFPVVLMIVPLFIVLRNLRLLDTQLGLALAYSTFLLPLCIWMMKGFFDAVPPDLEDAARVDGCSRIEALTLIVLPLVRSGLVATAIFIAIGAWNEYLFALMLTTSQNSRTWPVGLQLMIGEFQLPWGTFSAGGIISIVPVIIFFAFIQQSIIRGITAGAIKG
jgi:multiple sugar transport system permease protein